MIQHNKKYENVFSEDSEKSRTKLNLDEIKIKEMDLQEYVDLFNNFLHDFYNNLFLDCVKLSWMRRKFIYYGHKMNLPIYRNPMIVQNAFVKFLRRTVGNDIQMITKGSFFTKFESVYFDKMFPNFEEENPFENPDYYKFPYENITPDFLIVVYQLEERFEILKYADDKKMSYAKFLDYVVNHILSENDRLGRDKYSFRTNNQNTPQYVIDNDKKPFAKKGKKRI